MRRTGLPAATPSPAALAVVLLVGLADIHAPALAQQDRAAAWQAEKCARYRAAWTEALARFGRQGLGAAFLDRHEAFLAAGCPPQRDVCPRTSEELALADAMTLAALNAGLAGTFLPFACRE